MVNVSRSFEPIPGESTRGLLIVHTGDGKGKSTAAFGMILRCLGYGFPVGMVQFGKGTKPSGERMALERFSDLIRIETAGRGFTWEVPGKEANAAVARAGWQAARAMLDDPALRLVVLDELNFVLGRGFLSLDEVLPVLCSRRPDLHVVVTGRGAPEALTALADLVTEMREIRHPFRRGIMAQPGIDC